MLRNIRVACLGGGVMDVAITPEDRRETKQLLEVQFSAPEVIACQALIHAAMLTYLRNCITQGVITKLMSVIDRVTTGELFPCANCGIQLQYLLLVPTCGHLLCSEVVEIFMRFYNPPLKQRFVYACSV